MNGSFEEAFFILIFGGLVAGLIVKLLMPGKKKLPDDPLKFEKGEIVYFSTTQVHKGKVTAVQDSDDVTLGFQTPYTVTSRSFGKTMEFHGGSIHRSEEAARREPVAFL